MSLIQHLSIDLGFLLIGDIADIASTYFKERPWDRGPHIQTDYELNPETREGMEKEGAGRYLLKRAIKDIPIEALKLGSLFGLDYLVGIHDNWYGLHHLYAYGHGSLSYLAAIGNVLSFYGHDTLAEIVHTIPKTIYYPGDSKIVEWIKTRGLPREITGTVIGIEEYPKDANMVIAIIENHIDGEHYLYITTSTDIQIESIINVRRSRGLSREPKPK